MTKNLISIIAKELGVEFGEEFQITNYEKTIKFKFDNTGLLAQDGEDESWCFAPSGTLIELIYGDQEIIKLSSRPKYDEQYWTYDMHCRICKWTWFDNFEDYCRKAIGCVFRTKEEAVAAFPVKYKELTGKEWEKVK